MNIDPYILAFSAITVIATIWMGFRSAKTSKTASDFFVAGRSVSVGWNASAISGEYLSAASFMGVAGMVMSSGYDALWYPVCYACGYLFLLLFIAGPLRRFGAYTIPDFAEGRFDSPLFRKIAVVFVLFIGFFYTMPQMKGAGTTLAYIFPGLPYWAGVVLVGAVITLNVALGGMKGITLVQAFQYWAKMFAISVPIFVLMAVYGHYGKQLGKNGLTPSPQPVVQADTALLRPENWHEATAAAEIPSLFRVSMGLGGARASAFRDVTFGPITNLPWNVLQLASNCVAITGNRHLVSSELTNSTVWLTQPSRLNATQYVAMVEQTLQQTGALSWIRAEGASPEVRGIRTNQIAVIRESGIVRWVPNDRLQQYQAALAEASQGFVRASLPDKAPADSTWLSPFGPLTTKAAKAAAPNLVRPDWSKRSLLYEPDPISRQKPDWILTLERILLNFKDSPKHAEKVKYGTGEEGRPMSEVCIVFQMWANLAHVRCETNLLAKNIVFNSDTFQSPAELTVTLKESLGKQGVTLIEASPKEWWAVSSATAESWLKPFDTKPYALLYTYSLIIALVCGTAGLPHILVRFYTNPDGVAAKRTTMWVMILIGVFYVFPPVFGVMGRNLMPSLYEGTGAKGTDKVVLELPRILNQRTEGDVPRRGEGSEGQTTSSPSPTPSQPSPPSRDSSSGIPWGSILSGITCAGAFAAFMSTFSGLLVSMTGAMAHDVYGRMLNPKATPAQRLRAFKIAAVGIGAVAILLGTQVEALQINFMVGQAFAIAAASYFPLLFMSCWWRGMTMRGAAVGMLTGGVCALAAVTLTNFSDLKWLDLAGFWAAHPLLRILCEQPAIWTVPLAIGLMVIVSKLTSREIPADIRMKMLVLHAPEKLGLKQEYIQEHAGH